MIWENMIKVIVALPGEDDLSIAIELNTGIFIVSNFLRDHWSDTNRDLHSRFGIFAIISFLRLNIHLPINYKQIHTPS